MGPWELTKSKVWAAKEAKHDRVTYERAKVVREHPDQQGAQASDREKDSIGIDRADPVSHQTNSRQGK